MDNLEASPGSIALALTKAINAHDVDGALACFAENAVLHTPGRQPSKHSGKEQIRAWLQDDADHNISVEAKAAQVAGNTLIGTARITNDALRQRGIGHITGTLEIVVQGGKISSFTFTPEHTQ